MNPAPEPTPAAAPAPRAESPKETRKRALSELEEIPAAEESPAVEGVNYYDSDTTVYEEGPEDEDYLLNMQKEILRAFMLKLERFDRIMDGAEKRIVRARGEEPPVKQEEPQVKQEELPVSPDLFRDPVEFFNGGK